MMKKSLLAAAAMAALPIHAAAAREPGSQSANHPDSAVPGLRVEALAGYDSDGFEKGILYGGRIGYDFRIAPHLLLGIDGEYDDVTTDQEFLLPPGPGLTAEEGPDLYVGGRATYALSSRFRLYGGAGYTRARHSSFFLINPAGGPFGPVGSREVSEGGFRLSAGAQLLLGRHAFIGAEYRYSDYGKHSLKRDQFVGTIGFRF
jgi:outer membrane immunogenic protein